MLAFTYSFGCLLEINSRVVVVVVAVGVGKHERALGQRDRSLAGIHKYRKEDGRRKERRNSVGRYDQQY